MQGITVTNRKWGFGRRGPESQDYSALKVDVLPPLKDGQFYIDARGAVFRHHEEEGDALIMAPESIAGIEDHLSANTRDKREKLMRLKLLIQMRDTVRNILRLQETTAETQATPTTETPWAADQRRLKGLYDNFTRTYGPINRVQMQKTGEQDDKGTQISFTVQPNLRKFRKDPDAMLVASIELYDEATDTAKPGPIFTERVLASRGTRPVVRTPRDALRHVLNDNAKLDMNAVAHLLPTKTKEAITKELVKQGLILLDPDTKDWSTREECLNGNVRSKLERARLAAESNPQYAPTVAALEKVKPADLRLSNIDFSPGSAWIPPNLIEEFGREVLGLRAVRVLYLAKTNKWFVDRGNVTDKDPADDPRQAARRDLLAATLNNKAPRSITKAEQADQKEVTSFLENEQGVGRRQQWLLAKFYTWIEKDPLKTARLEEIYNNLFNAEVTPQYDGTHMTLLGASLAIKPRPHQLNAAWRNIQRGNTLYAHEVGTGKTLASIIASSEMRRLGLIEKPAFVVPNHLLVQFSRDFMSLYPNAQILLLEPDVLDGDGPKRTGRERIEKFVKRARSQDWDAIFMTQAHFDRFEVSPAGRLQATLDDIREFKTLAARPDYAAHPGIDKHLTKIIDRKMVELTTFIKTELGDKSLPDGFDLHAAVAHDVASPIWAPVVGRFRKTALPSFEEMGVDYLFIDEAQDWKNLEIKSSNSALSLQGSVRAANLRSKINVLAARRPHRHVTIMTGTPISNSMSEIYTMQRFVAPQALRDKGISNFDAWRSVFADGDTTLEMSADGRSFRPVTRLARFKNVPELIRMFHGFADVVERAPLKLDGPKLDGGKPRTEAVPLGPRQVAIMDWLAARATQVVGGKVDSSKDNMLKIVGDGRLAALHPRLVWQRYCEDIDQGRYEGPRDIPETSGKLEKMVANIADIYHAHRQRTYPDINGNPDPTRGALQVVMCDLGVPNGVLADNSLYHDIRRQLISRGVPHDTIAFVHDYDSNRKKAQLFERCQRGQVSVLLGTTQRLGTGSNLQRRLIALHELDTPWRPSDVLQRGGRIDRPGNMNKIIHMYRYITEGSHDVYSWQALLRKARFIGQIMRGDPTIRRFDEVDTVSNEFGAILALASKKVIMFPEPETPKPGHAATVPAGSRKRTPKGIVL